MSSKFLNVQFSDGRIYEASKEPKDGYEEFTSTKGNVSYRKYYPKGVYGTLTAIEKRDSPIGEQIQLTLKDKNNDYNNIQFALYDTQGLIDNRFAENLIRTLPNMKIGEDYRIFPYVTQPTRDYKYGSSGVSVTKANIQEETVNKEDKVELAYRYLKKDEEVKEGQDVPKLVFKEQRGKNRPTAASLEEKTNFLYDVLMKFATTSENKPKEEPAPKADETKSFVAPKPEDNDLPF